MAATDSAPTTARCCPICGADMTDYRPIADVCSSRCRRKKATVLALLSGQPQGPYRCWADYEARERRGAPEEPCKRVDKIPSRSRRTPAGERAIEFVLAHCQEKPGHRTSLGAVYVAYLRWAQHHEPESPVVRSTLYGLIHSWAPIEGEERERREGRRGRPRIVFVGIVCVRGRGRELDLNARGSP